MTDAPHVLVIAEAGVNHDGSLDRALEMVDVAADAGADIVKFQTFRADDLASAAAPKAAYQAETTGASESQRDMLRRLELGPAAHRTLLARCRERGIEFLSTPFDPASLAFLVDDLGVGRLKLGSGELTNAPLLLAAARTGRPVVLSTGMGTLDEVRAALGVLACGYLGGNAAGRGAFQAAFDSGPGRRALAAKVLLLQCTSAYPTPAADVNLRAMDTLAEAFGLPVGYSDHTTGFAVAIAAVGRGAVAIEKHFTLDRTLPGPDHRASLEPAELAAMISGIREATAALGDGRKEPRTVERGTIPVARKSLVAARPIVRGEPFSEGNLAVKRPGTGRSPFDWWDLLGTPAGRDYVADEEIDP